MSEPLTVLQAVFLGALQGLTEWLPVSSSGHLVLAQHLFGIEAPVFFDLVLHVGTLAVVVVFFRSTVRDMLRALASLPRDLRARPWREAFWQDPERRLALLIVAGSVPTAVIAFTFESQLLAMYDSPRAVAFALLGTGTLLWLTRYATPRRVVGTMGLRDSIVIGACQGLAIIPGVSRSGATISAATFLGVERELAVRYSFLLSVPAIVGATLFQSSEAAVAGALDNLAAYAAGTAVAMAVGYAALWALVLIVRRGGLHYFAVYCWALGGATLAWLRLAAG